ncbi:fatty acid desaturase family protein [Shivajiella indica]|uniref:Fatty acid desaturase family protein n=1 Tax=Shivajiella indica TaxID=872115 RepID=A0ABW5B7Y2_9BACT
MKPATNQQLENYLKAKPRFIRNDYDSSLLNELRERVQKRIKTIPEDRFLQLRIKAILLPGIYFLIYIISLWSTQYAFFLLAYSLMGFMLVIIFLNLIHEVCHENLFVKKSYNRFYLYLFDLIGANSYMWKKRHVIFHHNFPNVTGWDSDIEKSKFVKVHPNDKGKWLTRYQHFIVFLYPFFLFNWFLIRDFKDFFSQTSIVKRLGPIEFKEFVKLFLFKIIFVFYIFVLPGLLTPFSYVQVFWAGILMFIVAGAFGLLVLLPPHVNTKNTFPDVDENNNLPNTWLKHQLLTTNDVDEHNWFTRHVMANFNYHVAHHLFPNVSYLNAREVTDEIKSFCQEHQLPYKSFPLKTALVEHFRLIKKNGSEINIWEDDM